MYQSTRPVVSSRRSLLLASVASTAFGLAQTPPTTAPAPGPVVSAEQLEGLPTFLLPVPGGATTIGLTSEQLVRAVLVTINPNKPELAAKETDAVARALKKTGSVIGPSKEPVETFLLGKWPVKNGEYEVFVKKMQALKLKVRPPFHWWRYGKKDDFEARLPDINKQFKAEGKLGPLLFWERHGEDFPYAVVDEFGKSIADHPVVYVSYRDAVRFAGWLGMRIPTELERTRAARGDGAHVWPWGANKEIGDSFTLKVLDHLKLGGARDRQTKVVGTATSCQGPYGHWDMTAQVLEYVAPLGFGPITDRSKFEAEWKLLQKDKLGALNKVPPTWKDDKVIVKGASYLSWGDPIAFLLDCRVAVQTTEAVESVGFRLAKSLKPGYDMLYSLVNSDYNTTLFANDQQPLLANQVGIERYVLDKNGFPDEYHGFSFAPVNYLSNEKNVQVARLEERSQTTPLVLGTFATTEKMLSPALTANIYTLTYRKEGMPKELTDAIKVGHKEVQAELKKKARGEEPKAEAEGEKPKASDWRTVLGRFGLSEKELQAPDAIEKLKMIRIGSYEVPTDNNLFLVFDGANVVAHLPAPSGLTAVNLDASEISMGQKRFDNVDRASIHLKGCAPLQQGQKRGVEWKLDLILDCGPDSATEKWRVPKEQASSNKVK